MWACTFCSFHNTNDTFLACAACGSERAEDATTVWVGSGSLQKSLSPETLAAPAAAAIVPKAKPARGAPPPPPPPKKQNSMDKIKPILDELVESERHYVTELQAIASVFLLPLKARAQDPTGYLISESDCNSIFGNVSEILRLNLDLLAAFDRALRDTGSKPLETRAIALCKVFQSFVPHLKMYAFYAITFDEATSLLKKLEEEKPRFAEFIHAVSGMNSITNGQPLASFLIKPIQRVCKYPLFFHQILKSFDSAEEHSALQATVKLTIDLAGDVANKINQDKLRAEQNLRGFEVAKKIDHLTHAVLEPGRRYVGEWKCLMSIGDNNLAKKRRGSSMSVKQMIVGEKKPRSCFLFNNALLICKEVAHSKTRQTYALKLWISLDQLQLCGINHNDPRPSSTHVTSAAESSSAASDGLGSYSKQFKLPLDFVHVAAGDRALTAALRERQINEVMAERQPLSQIARLPSTLLTRKKSSNNGEESASAVVVTSYTMWFRSPAERARVDLLVNQVYKDFTSPAPPIIIAKSASARLPPNSPLHNSDPRPLAGVAIAAALPSPTKNAPPPLPSAPRPSLPRSVVSAPTLTTSVPLVEPQQRRTPEQRKSRPRPPPPPPPPSAMQQHNTLFHHPPIVKDALTSKWFD